MEESGDECTMSIVKLTVKEVQKVIFVGIYGGKRATDGPPTSNAVLVIVLSQHHNSLLLPSLFASAFAILLQCLASSQASNHGQG